MLDQDRRLVPEIKLLLAIISQAILDAKENDRSAINFLFSKDCKAFCEICGIDRSYVLRLAKSTKRLSKMRKDYKLTV